MNGESLNIEQDNLAKLKEQFPNLFTEGKLDWEKLKATFSDDINVANERYVLNWAGKSDAFKVLQVPTTATTSVSTAICAAKRRRLISSAATMVATPLFLSSLRLLKRPHSARKPWKAALLRRSVTMPKRLGHRRLVLISHSSGGRQDTVGQ